MSDELVYSWRDPISDEAMVELVESHGGRPEAGWWDQIRPHSLGCVTARTSDGVLAGFVSIAWDGGDHAFLLDAKTAGEWQRRGVGAELVGPAAQRAKAAGMAGPRSAS
jgi:ribosomal protein S18 acetylase RimI-like enzyme